MTRDEKLARYRRLREINAGQQTDALGRISADTILEFGRRLGVAHGRTLACDSQSEMSLLFDLAVYTGKAGRSRGIERYARHVGSTLTGDEAMMLRAAQTAQFRLWRIERLHEIVGQWVTDIVSGGSMWLIDEGMEASCRAGLVFAGRLMAIDDFVMTCGVPVPLSVASLAAAVDNIPNLGYGDREDLLNDSRFTIGIYRSAIETGTMGGMEYLDPDELARETLLVE